ncbi:hypothetical protein ILUMI_21344 [Ignelater luminosus]|uniref:Metalloendopeptidase n=1 Tax=Ignelater luminosus TaxID=2038154 RepID=A0A8K0CFR3_IGNLU|nr:hypothetical protein ILUMI_21344 [Ignelater luminosus]
MASLKFWIALLLTWQLAICRTIPEEDKIELTPEQADILASWTEDNKQNIWELSGYFEGDMILAADQRNGLINTKYRWANNEIPYEIDSVFNNAQRQWIIHSLTEYYNKTCVKPRFRTANDVDYVYITGAPTGCHSYVGRRGGRQVLNLQLNTPGVGCFRLGTIVHEFLHALGFYHQQSASERDDYVDIIWQNIQEGKENNFNKYSSNVTTSFGEKYDYDSVMHYSAYAFSKNGERTIITKDPSAEIGQRLGLSDIDAIKLNKMYQCE